MKKMVMTKYCEMDSTSEMRTSSVFEKKFEAYIKRKVKPILDNPDKYPFIDVIVGK